MIRSMLVAGLGDPENNVVRFCRENWLDTEWLAAPEGSGKTKPIPERDAVIIVACYISHDMDKQIKTQYKNRPVFFYNSGMSDIKDKLLDGIWGASNKASLQNRDIPMHDKFIFIISMLNKKGVRLYERDFAARFVKIAAGTHKKDVDLSFGEMIMNGWINKRRDKSGSYYEFASANDEASIDAVMQKRGFFSVTPSAILTKPVDVPASKIFLRPARRLIPEVDVKWEEVSEDEWNQLYEVAQEHLEQLIGTENEEMGGPRVLKSIPEDAKTVETIESSFMLDFLEHQRLQIAVLDSQIAALSEQMQRGFQAVNTIATEIMPQLKGLSPEDLERVKQMMALMFGGKA